MANKKYTICLDVNGVLLSRYYKDDPDKPSREPDYKIKNHSIYLRPGFNKFINVMLHHFNVGIWSSVRKDNLDSICNTIFSREQLKRLMFVLDGSYCTIIPSDSNKPIMLKETQKIFDMFKIDPSNFVFVDDSEYKAKLNIHGISIHPTSYTGDITDNALCKNGELYQQLMNLPCLTRVP
jgi:hypothetical protein